MIVPRGIRPSAVGAAVLALLAALLLTPTPSGADTKPINPSIPKTVAADILPTPQIDGVAWTQTVVGDRVYVGGDFQKTRPFGAAVGQSETSRPYLLAYSISTGNLITSFAPKLNGQVLALAVSPDKKTLYVGGSFTTVNGESHPRIAAFDAASGALRSNFKTVAGSSVRAIAATNSTVYFAGDFTKAGDKPGAATVARSYLAAAKSDTGAILPWKPVANAYIRALTLNAAQTLVVAGGHFDKMNGATRYGMAALDPNPAVKTPALKPWGASSYIQNWGTAASVTSLTSDSKGILITAYTFQGHGNFESVARVDGNGNLIWISDCRGDTHSAYSLGNVVYTASHAHRCSNVPGGQEERWPRYSPGQVAYTDYKAGVLLPDVHNYYQRTGQPAPAVVNFSTRFLFGTYTPSNQGPWNVTGNDKYLVYGGEFVGLNNKLQQGLTRMARTDIAPNKAGPVTSAELTPSAKSYASGQAFIGWTTTFDSDNERLTYRLYRNYKNSRSTPVYTATADSAWHQRGSMSFVDTGLTPGTRYEYLVIASDPFGNTKASGRTSVTASSSNTANKYGNAVARDLPAHYFRFSGSAATLPDAGGNASATTKGGLSIVAGPAVADSGNTVGSFAGGSNSYSAVKIQAKPPKAFTVEAWFKSTDGSGGRIAGFSTHYNGKSDWTDRHIYLDSAGAVRFGVDSQSKTKVTIASGAGLDNGAWHHVAATLSGSGMVLYVDGKKVASNASVTEARRMTGSWRIGTDQLTGWAAAPADGQFAGQIDEVAIYPKALTAAQIAAHYAARK